MKKSVVLFISLLFISALSVLVIQSLDDTNNFLSQSHDKFNKIQAVSLMDNLQKEISKKINENKDNIKDIIADGLITNAVLSINDINMIFSLSIYDKVNLNDLNSKDKQISKSANDILYSYEIYNTDFIRSFIKQSQSEDGIKTTKQLEFLIYEYARQNDDEKIYEIKSLLGFLENKNLYELRVKLDENNLSNMSSYFVLDDKGEVKYFEYSIN